VVESRPGNPGGGRDTLAEGVYNRMPAAALGPHGWRRPWSGSNGGSCVEAMRLADGRIALRQSTDPDGPALIYGTREIRDFIQGAKSGAADFLLTPAPTSPSRPTGAHRERAAHQ
jgi:hypothetical protein